MRQPVVPPNRVFVGERQLGPQTIYTGAEMTAVAFAAFFAGLIIGIILGVAAAL
jgi:hypothetical protein